MTTNVIGRTGDRPTDQLPRTRKAIATTFLEMCSTGDVGAAYDRFIADEFRHHNAFFRGDADSLAAGMEANAKQFPEKTLQIQRALEDGDLVAIHSRVQMTPGGQEMALVHIFRFVGDRIIELWDIGQAVPEESPNENGAF